MEVIMAISLGVSIYSFQEELFLGRMTLEEAVAAVAGKVGAKGVVFPTSGRQPLERTASWLFPAVSQDIAPICSEALKTAGLLDTASRRILGRISISGICPIRGWT